MGDFELQYNALHQKFLEEIKAEIDFLEACIKITNRGGWSTHLNNSIIKRCVELKERYYSLLHKSIT